MGSSDEIAYQRVKAAQKIVRTCKSKEEVEEKFKGTPDIEFVRMLADYRALPDNKNNKGAIGSERTT